MPFCSSCGAPFNSGEKFCMQCGAPIVENRNIVAQNSSIVSAIYQQRSIRIESFNEVAHMIEYFSPMQPKYDEYDQCSETIGECSRNHGSTVGIGVFLCVLGSAFLLILLYFAGVSGIVNSIREDPESFLISMLLSFAILGACLFLGPYFIASSIVKEKNRNKRLMESINRQVVLANELTNHYNNYGNICLVGAEFSNPRILALISNTLRQGRADTIKDAINVMFDDAHKTQMELQAQLTTQAAMQAARGATTAAVFSAARFFI